MKHKLKLKGQLSIILRIMVVFGILLAGLDIWIYSINVKAGVGLSVFVVFYLILLLIMINYNKTILMNELVSFATQYGQIQSRLLRDLEIPSALLDESGKVIWTNRSFENTVHIQKQSIHKEIKAIFPSLSKDKFPDENTDITETSFSFEQKEYTAKMRRIPLSEMVENSDIFESEEKYEGYLIILYLFDETALKIALRENDNQSLCIGLLYIDNYEEALEGVEEVRRSLLIALVERKLNKYFSSYDAVVKKMEKDKFFFIVRKQALGKMKENRFDILEDVKTLKSGNEISVTISMGIGSDGLSYSQNYEYARTSIDVALGRGGDQVVIKTPENVLYFGGKSQQLEKSTRVRARVKALALKEIISGKDKVIVMGHANTDVDSFGAAVGIYRIAKTLGKSVSIVLNNSNNVVGPWVDAFRDRLDKDEKVIVDNLQAVEIADSNTVLVIVDVNKPSYTECPELLKYCRSVVVLDHHRQGEEIIENAVLSYVEPYASSACEMVAEILQYVGDGIKVRGVEADCMYAGIVVDTTNFKVKAGVRTFEAAAFLRRCGADVTRVRKMFREAPEDYQAKADAVSHAEIYMNEYAISVCRAQNTTTPTVVCAQAANELLNINGIKASFVLMELSQKVFISARSIDEVNVQIIMEKLGGGGHINVAGAQIPDISMEDAIAKLKDLLQEMKQNGEI